MGAVCQQQRGKSHRAERMHQHSRICRQIQTHWRHCRSVRPCTCCSTVGSYQSLSSGRKNALRLTSGLRFRQLSVNDCQTFGRLLESVERVSGIITMYTELEARVLLRTSILTAQLSAALVKLYTATLIFLSQAHHYYQQRTISEFSHFSWRNIGD